MMTTNKLRELDREIAEERATMTPETTNPGSDEAIVQGCTCARMDNGYGRGYRYIEGREPVFVITDGCPLHTPHTPRREQS